MRNRVFEIAASIIDRTDQTRAADAVLRSELKTQRTLPRALSGEVARAVFSYYRWLGWLDRKRSLDRQLLQADELARGFVERPDSFSHDELRRRAIPSWIIGLMEIPKEWLRVLQREPVLWLRARPGQRAELARRLGDCHSAEGTTLSDALAYIGAKDLFRTPNFHKGEFELQDIASQAVGQLCCPKPGDRWWDACAGEGGKTLHLADLMQNRGLIWATDRAGWRLERFKRRAARAKIFNYRTALWDGSARLPNRTRFDGVLVDAPCSGIGTWQRNPQARWTTTVQDVEELACLQRGLLTHTTPAVKPGGKLIYAVCTLTSAETTEVADDFEKRFPEFEPFAVANPFQPAAPITARHCWWPQQTGGNGMFVAAWRKAIRKSESLS